MKKKHSALKYWRPKLYSKEPHVKFWPFTLKIFSQLLDKIKLFCKQRKIIEIKFRSIWSILKALTASRFLNIYKNNVLFRKAPLEGSASNLWIRFIWLLLLFFSPSQVVSLVNLTDLAGQGDRHDHNRSKESCFNEVLPRYHFCLEDPPNKSRYVL